MINYSTKMIYEDFKIWLLNERFFKPSNDYQFENLDTNSEITNSFVYKLAKELVNKEYTGFKCNFKKIYYGEEDTETFKSNFLGALYAYSVEEKKTDSFLKSLSEVFQIILDYEPEIVASMYKTRDFNGIRNLTIQNNTDDVQYKFYWDVIGYAFGKLQCNIAANKAHLNFLRNCGFTESEIEFLTEVPKGKTTKQLTERVSHLNAKLKQNSEALNKYECSQVEERMRIISNYPAIKQILFEKEKTFIHLMYYDNQYRFTQTAKNNAYLYWHLLQKIKNKDYVLTSEFIKEYKLNYTKFGKANKDNVERTYNTIENNIADNGVRNLTIDQINKVITPQTVLDAMTMNELSIVSDTVTINNIETLFKLIINGITKATVAIDDNNLPAEEVKKANSIDKIAEKVNEVLDIPDEIQEDTPLNAYQVENMFYILKQLMTKFINISSIDEETTLVKSFNEEFTSLCNSTFNLKSHLELCNKRIDIINKSFSTSVKDTSSENYKSLAKYFNNFAKAYGYMMENEFAKTELLIKGTIDEVTAKLFKTYDEINTFADSFLSSKPSIERTETKDTNPFSIFLKNSKFLYLKELDYRNLEATLRMSNKIKPSTLGCERIWILIYIILNIQARKNEMYNCENGKICKEDFMSHAASLLNNMRLKKWKHDYSDIEKFFSLMYPFVKIKSNPFTSFMNDTGFNQSQNYAIELRNLLESQREEVINNIKDAVYGPNGIYDIFQGLADLAYELSSPVTLYTDFSFINAGTNVINEFMNACISSIEMQTTMAIYDFIFNFEININGKGYSLNSLNNMIKMFNVIVKISQNNTFESSIRKYNDIARYTSDYLMFNKLGFFTYNKKWNNLYSELSEDLLKKLTGYYLSDEPDLYDTVEYCRKKSPECNAGDISELMARVNRLNKYEWIAIYANHRLKNEDKHLSQDALINFMNDNEMGYVNIQRIYSMMEQEANNTNPEITYVTPYIEDLGERLIHNEEELNDFISDQKTLLYKFRKNIIKNESILVSAISDNLSETKIYDWMMKMFPTYEMIAKAFGFASLSGLGQLDNFISSLMKNLNCIIKIVFDKWKTETTNAMKTRRFQLIEKERYYYIQAFPVMIDWIIKNLEYYIGACGKIIMPSDGIDLDTFNENWERINKLSERFIINLKEELSCMSRVQIKEFEKKLEEAILSVDNIDKEKGKQLLKDIMQFENLGNVTLDFLNDDQKLDLLNKIKNLINVQS